MDAGVTSEKISTETPRPSWLRRHCASMIVVLLLSVWMLFANLSGLPGLARLNEQQILPPSSGTVTQNDVYGWPIVSRQYTKTVAKGGTSTGSRGGSGGLINLPLCLLLLTGAVFFTEWIVERKHRAGLLAASPGDAEQVQLDIRRKSFRAFWWNVVRWYVALALMLVGTLIILGSLSQALRSGGEYAACIEITQRNGGHGYSYSGSGAGEVSWTSIGTVVGGVILLAGLAVILRRFNLRVAIAAVLALGALGSLPLVLAGKPPMRAEVSFGFDQGLTPEHFAALRGKLSDVAPLAASLPEPIAEQLPPKLGLRAVRVVGHARDGGQGLKVVFDFENFTTAQQRQLAFTIFEDYIAELTMRAVKAEGRTFQHTSGVVSATDWTQYRDAWCKKMANEFDAAFAP